MIFDREKRSPALALSGAGGLTLLLVMRLVLVVHSGHAWLALHRSEVGRSHGEPATKSKAASAWAEQPWTDSFQDGTPDFLRLTDPADQAAFRQWFTAIAEFEAARPKADVPAEINDCASLLRYAYREALKRHNDSWFATTGVEIAAMPGEIGSWHYPETPLGEGLFRVRAGSFQAADAVDGAFAQFADAKTLVEFNTYRVSRDVRQAEPGDLLFYRQFGESSPWHSMIVVRNGGQAAVVYNTGIDHGKAGELRRVLVSELLDHPQAAWRPVAANPNFLGVYRWNILRGNL